MNSRSRLSLYSGMGSGVFHYIRNFLMSKDEDELSSDDEEMEMEIRRLRRSRKDAVMSFLANIPILGWILNFIISFIARKIAEVKRRRRSFKIGLYFQAQMALGLIGFLLFLIVAIDDMSWLSDTTRVATECILAPSVKLTNGTSIQFYDSEGVNINVPSLYEYVKSERAAIPCSNENLHKIDAACTLSQFQLLLYMMLALAVCFIVSMAVCAVVFSGFNFFSNIPMESLDIDVTSCKVTFLGAACKHGPWVQKVLTISILGLVITLTLLPVVTSYCQGSLTSTHSCINMYDDCFYNQFRNCRYYFSSNCVGTNLPHASSQSTNFENCKNPDFAKRFSGRYDVRLVFPTPCSRCWALDSDCKGAAENSLRFTDNKTSVEFVYDTSRFTSSPVVPASDLVLGREIYCNCVIGVDKVGTTTGNALSLNFDPQRLTRNNTDCTGLLAASACPATLTGFASNPPFDANATYMSEFWQDTAAGTNNSQMCWWAPQTEPAFFYDSEECSQAGSTLNRYVFIVSYITVTLTVLLLLIGLSVQYTVQPETWSYTPQRRDERWYWRLLRHLGPG
jgi:hypothetical protein